MAAGEINTSLFGAADEAGLPDAVTLQIADVFAGDIDFYHDLRRGDRFAVVYEMRYVDGEPVGAGRIVAAEFVNGGRRCGVPLARRRRPGGLLHRRRRADAPRVPALADGVLARDVGLLERALPPDPAGLARAPRCRLRAPTGTPVRATADAKVTFAGTQGGYGNVIVLRHQGVYSTLYAHLSRFAPDVRTGARVAQGEVIGYVGQTGWATGPHLHYEFRVDDEQRNPLTVALPSGEPLAPEHRLAFAARIAPAVAQLALAERVSGAQLASSE